MKNSDYVELWHDAKNWRLYVFYVCREDPRLIVPKRLRMTGWTMNFAHPQAYLLFAALLAVVIIPISIVETMDLSIADWVRPVTVILSIGAAFALTWWASRVRME